MPQLIVVVGNRLEYKMYKDMFGIYGCWNASDLIYIGSSKLKLEWLENNHRAWKEKNYSWTRFRGDLADIGQDWLFKWIQQPRPVSREQIEIEEGALIRYAVPVYNKDMFPYEHSVREGRVRQV